LNVRQAEYQRALNWARFFCPRGYEPRQCVTWAFGKADVETLLSKLGQDGKLRERFNMALAGYHLLDGMTVDKLDKVSRFPTQVWLGLGCSDCGLAVCCEISGRCMNCCHKAAKEPSAPRPIKGLTGPNAPTAQFTVFQARAIMQPMQFEMHFEVPFDGLLADVKPLRAALSEDLIVKDRLEGGTVFTRVERCGKRLWEKSPEQAMYPGSKLTAGWFGVTDAVFRAKIRNVQFVLLEDTIHNVKTLEDLGNLKMSRTFCKDHALEAVTTTIGLSGIDLSSLKSSASLRTDVTDSLKRVIGARAEIADPKTYVDVVLSCLDGHGHGMKVHATVAPPTGTLPSAVVSRLSCPSLGDAVVDAMSAVMAGVAHLESAIKVDGIGAPKVVRVPLDMLEDPDMRNAARQRPCKNCCGVLRLRFSAPARFAERRAQLQDLGHDELMQRAQLCGLRDEATTNGASPEGRKATLNLIVKSEGIIR